MPGIHTPDKRSPIRGPEWSGAKVAYRNSNGTQPLSKSQLRYLEREDRERWWKSKVEAVLKGLRNDRKPRKRPSFEKRYQSDNAVLRLQDELRECEPTGPLYTPCLSINRRRTHVDGHVHPYYLSVDKKESRVGGSDFSLDSWSKMTSEQRIERFQQMASWGSFGASVSAPSLRQSSRTSRAA